VPLTSPACTRAIVSSLWPGLVQSRGIVPMGSCYRPMQQSSCTQQSSPTSLGRIAESPPPRPVKVVDTGPDRDSSKEEDGIEPATLTFAGWCLCQDGQRNLHLFASVQLPHLLRHLAYSGLPFSIQRSNNWILSSGHGPSHGIEPFFRRSTMASA